MRRGLRIERLLLTDPKPEVVRIFPLARVLTAANANWALKLGLAGLQKNPEPTDVPGYFRQHRKRLAASQAEGGRFLLERPEGKFLDDGFYVRVARAYRDATARALNPRQTLARDTGSAPDTVARWVGEARRRGHLPPTKPGRVTA